MCLMPSWLRVTSFCSCLGATTTKPMHLKELCRSRTEFDFDACVWCAITECMTVVKHRSTTPTLKAGKQFIRDADSPHLGGLPLLFDRQREIESSPFVRFGLCPDPATMTLDDTAYRRKSDPA